MEKMVYNAIKRYYAKEKMYMTLESILARVEECPDITLLSEAHNSLKRISEDIFYIQPKYEEITRDPNAKFIIFSAPGASGKSTLAKYIAKKENSIYWDLSKIKLGEGSFHGTLWKALGNSEMLNYLNNLKSGRGNLVLDAFDEAEIISGRSGIEYLLNDLNEVTGDSKVPTIFLFARTESALFLANYCSLHRIPFSQYEIGFFEEYNSKIFIKEKLKSIGRGSGPVIDNCIEEQFVAIKEILGKADELSKSFLGYAPVLEALAAAFDEEKNTIKLLEKIKRDKNTGTDLIYNILKDLLEREQRKVICAIKERWGRRFPHFSDWDAVYSIEEQMVRLVEYILFDEVVEDGSYKSTFSQDEIYDDYIEVLKMFLPQHPFVQTLSKNQSNVEFTGPAFRDFALSFVLSIKKYEDLAFLYFNDFTDGTYFPSQLFFDFYYLFSKGVMYGKYFPLLYDSFKAKETAASFTSINICGDGDEIFVNFRLSGDDKGAGEQSKELKLVKNTEGLFISRVSNANIDINLKITIGDAKNSSRIVNSSIIGKSITFSSPEIILETVEPDFLIIASKENALYVGQEPPKFTINADRNNMLKISFPNINSFYRLRPYRYELDNNDGDDSFKFMLFIRKLLGCLRKHRKDFPAKDKEFIDNEIISRSKYKRSVMDFLVSREIIFIDPVDAHLYKLNPDKLALYNLNWAVLNQNDEKAFNKLYEDYQKFIGEQKQK